MCVNFELLFVIILVYVNHALAIA